MSFCTFLYSDNIYDDVFSLTPDHEWGHGMDANDVNGGALVLNSFDRSLIIALNKLLKTPHAFCLYLRNSFSVR